MTNKTKPSPVAEDVPADINKESTSGLWRKNARWRDALYKSVCHQALDVPEDEMIQANRVTSGVGWKEILVLGALALGGGYLLLPLLGKEAAAPPAVQAPAPLADPEYEVRFYDAAGNPIQLERWPGGVPRLRDPPPSIPTP